MKNIIKILLLGLGYMFLVTPSQHFQNIVIVFNTSIFLSICIYLLLRKYKQLSILNIILVILPLLIAVIIAALIEGPEEFFIYQFFLPYFLGQLFMYFFLKKEMYYKIITTLIFLITIGSASFYFLPEFIYNSSMEKVEKRVSTFELINEKGETLNYNELKGKIIFIDFFTTYCGNCIRNFPKVEKLRKEYEGNSNVVFMYVNAVLSENTTYDLFLKYVPKYQEKYKLKTPFYYDKNKQLTTQLKIDGVPCAVIIDKNGKVNYEYSGAPKDDILVFHDNIKHIIDKLLEE